MIAPPFSDDHARRWCRRRRAAAPGGRDQVGRRHGDRRVPEARGDLQASAAGRARSRSRWCRRARPPRPPGCRSWAPGAWSCAADSDAVRARWRWRSRRPPGRSPTWRVSWNQTSVTLPPVRTTCRPAARVGPSDGVHWMPPAQPVAPRGSAHRNTVRPALLVSPIQPM